MSHEMIGKTVVCERVVASDMADEAFYRDAVQIGVPARIIAVTFDNRFTIAYRFVGDQPTDWIVSVDGAWLRDATEAEIAWFDANQMHPLPRCNGSGGTNGLCAHILCTNTVRIPAPA